MLDAPEAVARWAETHFGGSVTMAEPPAIAGDGYDTAIHLVRFSGGSLPPEWTNPLVLRVHPTADRLELAEREAAIHGFLAADYPVPWVLAVLPPGAALDLPVQVMERAPGTNGLAAIEGKPWRAPGLMTTFGALHARLHAVPTSGWPEAAGTMPLARRRLRLVHRVLEDKSLPASELDHIRRALARVEPLLATLDVGEPVVCHGDFHPMNVMVEGDSVTGVIDWTDACLGDPVGDVARFLDVLELAAAGAPKRTQRLVLKAAGPPLGRRYLRAYEQAAGRRVDPARLRQWQPVHVLHDWVRAAITVAAQGDGPARARPEVIEWLRHRFDRVVAT